ncbi:thioesterase family protein [Nocardia sp. NBC_00881]|uniref:acyl-CoA thioesterase n=1 Tax=Nocardia sp. NBC_00881 TaxID=2975995 RepID=UPI0038694A8C|nr:thioesterase family protein [Nocardia sp. NBC_00881]
MSFSTRIEVRVSDLDPQLHVTGAAYHQFADHSRFACVQAAGVSVDELIASGFGPVNLETVISFQVELRGGDAVDVSCTWRWGEGKTYRVEHVLTRADGVVAATVTNVSGLLDLASRRLIAEPAREWAARASCPELLGLPH